MGPSDSSFVMMVVVMMVVVMVGMTTAQYQGMNPPPPPPGAAQYGPMPPPPPPPGAAQYGPMPPPPQNMPPPPPQGMSGGMGMPPPPMPAPAGMGGGMGGPPPPGPGGPPPMGPPGPPAAAPVGGMGMAPPTYNHQISSSHCRYLVDAPSPWGTNASPFRLYTRSHSGEIRRGHPIEVSILPQYQAFKYFNFTDFALWCEPHMMVNTRPPAPVEPEKAAFMPPPIPSPMPPGPNDVTHLGVWQVFPKYASGASTLKCNTLTQGEDTVGSFEERMLELLKTQFPMDGRLFHFHPSARHGAAFLWYPDERTMATVYSVKFVAKVKAFGQWFRLESGHWRVHRPPPPRRYGMRRITPRRHTQNQEAGEGSFSATMERISTMNQQLHTMERQLERTGNVF